MLRPTYDTWEKLVTEHDVKGRAAHDARLVAAMKVHAIDRILTFNGADFSRYIDITVIDPELAIQSGVGHGTP